MSEAVVSTLLVLSVLIGIGGASYLAFSSSKFWGELITELAVKAWPQIRELITARMTPEEEAEWRAAVRAGREDEFMRKRRGAPPKG